MRRNDATYTEAVLDFSPEDVRKALVAYANEIGKAANEPDRALFVPDDALSALDENGTATLTWRWRHDE